MKIGLKRVSALAGALATALLASTEAWAFTNKSMNGSYACILNGSFMSAPNSQAFFEFTTDGAGDVIGTSSPAKISNEAGSYQASVGILVSATTVSGTALLFNGAGETCSYTIASGIYSINGNGSGTLQVNLTPAPGNPDGTGSPPFNCATAAMVNSQVLLSSTSQLTLMAGDPLLPVNCNNNVAGNINYAHCGELMSGACTKQKGAKF